MFDKVRKNFGFCCMRLPMQGKEVDYAEFNKMIDAFLDNGFNYFVPAHGYLDGHTICLCRGDVCPMEKTVAAIDDPDEAYAALLEKIRNMKQ